MENETAKPGKELLEGAYALETSADNVAYYRLVAKDYDTDFGDKMGYHYPAALAKLFDEFHGDLTQRVLDIGCGTGLVAEALTIASNDIDGADISPQMLAIARSKALYRQLYEIDLTSDIQSICNGYGTIVSAGTFTHGHLGPNILARLLDVASPGATFLIGVNKSHYSNLKFAATMNRLLQAGSIRNLKQFEVPVYQGSDHDHANDTALVLVFQTAG